MYKRQIPSLLPWFHFTHGQSSPLFYNREVITSTRGTQQGDPLGPAFFALAIHKVASSIRGVPGLEWLAWYLDDGILVGEPAALLGILQTLTGDFKAMGLTVNPGKCALWSPASILDIEGSVPVVDWTSPKKVLGTPFGTQEAVRKFLAKRRAAHHVLLQKLALLPDPQAATALLRHCLGAQKTNHLQRVLWSPEVHEFISETEEDIRATLDSVLGTCLSDSTWAQCCLPTRYGGLGLSLIHI